MSCRQWGERDRQGGEVQGVTVRYLLAGGQGDGEQEVASGDGIPNGQMTDRLRALNPGPRRGVGHGLGTSRGRTVGDGLSGGLCRRVRGSVDARITHVKLSKGTGRGGEGSTSQHVQPLVGQEGGAQTDSHSSSSSGSGRSTVTLPSSTLTRSPGCN